MWLLSQANGSGECVRTCSTQIQESFVFEQMRFLDSWLRIMVEYLARLLAIILIMTSVPLGEAKNRLSEYVTDVERTHDRVLITRHGHPAAVLIAPEDLAALEETIDILTTAGAREAITEGLDDLAAGRIADNDSLRARLASR
jgi:prevent-host-death family protein